MLGEAAAVIAASSKTVSEISTYIATLGGVAAVAQLLGVPQRSVRRWQQGEPPPPGAMFFLDEAYCQTVDAPSIDDFEVATVRR
jgi:hypothetical protein